MGSLKKVPSKTSRVPFVPLASGKRSNSKTVWISTRHHEILSLLASEYEVSNQSMLEQMIDYAEKNWGGEK
jgi:hypothetical protein